jgi:hypothetical protein
MCPMQICNRSTYIPTTLLAPFLSITFVKGFKPLGLRSAGLSESGQVNGEKRTDAGLAEDFNTSVVCLDDSLN